MKYSYITASLLALLPVNDCTAQVIQDAPKLVVNITIDQLRSDYLETFAPLYSKNGFKRLLENGRVYTNSSYPFTPIDRSSAIASLATGTTPYYNGIVGQKWLNRESLRPVNCEDGNPTNLNTSTVGDELKVATNGQAKVYSIAPYSDAAVFSAGHAADAALWINDGNGLWCTSPYYVKSMPEWIMAFNSLNKPQVTGFRNLQQYKSSGKVNENVKNIALQCISSNAMGVDNIPDLLSITYYAGSNSSGIATSQNDMQTAYMDLDRTLADFISKTEMKIGSGNVLFIITSTGYTDEDHPEYKKYRIPTGTFYINRTANLLNMYFNATYGQGRYVENCFHNEIYLSHKIFEQKRINFSDALERAQEFLSQVSGIRDVYTSQRLLSAIGFGIDKKRNGYNVDRSGDILIEVAPGWRLVNEDNSENQLSRANFVQFPIIIYGAGTKAERINTPVTIDRIAPTISKAIRIRAPNACSSEPLF